MNQRYLDYLKSKDWGTKREVRLNATDGCCDICSTENWSNDVHHVKYAPNLEHVKLWDLKVLCRRCHNAVHEVLAAHKEHVEAPDQSLVRWNRTLRGILYMENVHLSVLNKIRKKLKMEVVEIEAKKARFKKLSLLEKGLREKLKAANKVSQEKGAWQVENAKAKKRRQKSALLRIKHQKAKHSKAAKSIRVPEVSFFPIPEISKNPLNAKLVFFRKSFKIYKLENGSFGAVRTEPNRKRKRL